MTRLSEGIRALDPNRFPIGLSLREARRDREAGAC